MTTDPNCPFCEEPWEDHSEPERVSCERDIEAYSRRLEDPDGRLLTITANPYPRQRTEPDAGLPGRIHRSTGGF